VPKLTTAIVACALGIIKDASARTGQKVNDIFTICDSSARDSPEDWRAWLAADNLEAVPAKYVDMIRTMGHTKLATKLREKALEKLDCTD
jgi:hypothetical protein